MPNLDDFGRPIPTGVLRCFRHESARWGRCYELSFRVQQRSREPWTLIHGSLRREDRTRYDHAWLESPCGNFVFCAVWNAAFTQAHFTSFTRPKEHRRYTKSEARAAVRVTGHYGPTWPRNPRAHGAREGAVALSSRVVRE